MWRTDDESTASVVHAGLGEGAADPRDPARDHAYAVLHALHQLLAEVSRRQFWAPARDAPTAAGGHARQRPLPVHGRRSGLDAPPAILGLTCQCRSMICFVGNLASLLAVTVAPQRTSMLPQPLQPHRIHAAGVRPHPPLVCFFRPPPKPIIDHRNVNPTNYGFIMYTQSQDDKITSDALSRCWSITCQSRKKT